MNGSLASSTASLPPSARARILASLSEAECAALEYDWPFWARPSQLAPPGEWDTWMICAGRGAGKTRSGAEWVRMMKDREGRGALVAPTAADARDVMVEGESGLLAISPPWDRPIFEPSRRRVVWRNGAVATLYSAEEPERLRGPQHGFAWCDELAAWKYDRDTWDMLQFGLRLGERPRAMVTTTPKPRALVREILASPTTVVTRGSTYDNAANLAPAFLEAVRRRYEGTRLGRQELLAELLDDVEGALWTRDMFDAHRVHGRAALPDMARVVVAVDPSGTAGAADSGDSIGIVVAGKGVDGNAYVLADRSCKLSPAGWGARAVAAYHEFGADRIVAERNFGGAMVEHVIRTSDPTVAYREVTASRGKFMRAEPVAALYEQGRVRHLGALNDLEDQACLFGADGYLGDGSPDRLDAMVWAVTDLMLRATSKFEWYVGA